MTPIERREKVFTRLENRSIWDIPLSGGEIDIIKRETLSSKSHASLIAWCVSDCERRVSKIRFHSHWGRACSSLVLFHSHCWVRACSSVVLLVILLSPTIPPVKEAPVISAGQTSAPACVQVGCIQ